MSLPALERTTDDLRRDGRGGLLRRLARTIGWGAAGAVAAGGAWAIGVIAVRVASRGTGWPIPDEAQPPEHALVLAAICGGWGIVVGAVAGLMFGGQRARAVILWGFGMAATGAAGGALVLPLVAATRHSLPAEAGSSLAFAAAGLLAGLVGSVYGRGVAGPSHRATARAAGWGVTGAVVAGGAWAGGLLLARHFFRARFGVVTPDGLMTESAITAAIGFVGGLLAETAVGLVRRDRRDPVPGALVIALGGAAAGGLSPVVARAARWWLPPEASSTALWAVAGLLAGLVGSVYGRRRTASESEEDDAELTTPRREALPAARWALTGAVAVGAGWAAGLVVAHIAFGGALDVAEPNELATAVLIAAVIGGLVGLVAGTAVGLARGRGRWGPGLWALVGTAVGGAAVGLTPVVMAAARRWLSPEASSTAYWAGVGLLTGLVGYSWAENRQPAELADEEELPGEQPERARVRRSVRRPAPAGPLVRLLPIFAISSGCLIAAIVERPSPAGWAVLAVGLLGFAAAWAFAGQERRIRELERRLREKQQRD